jgi:hypothetical protein
LMYPHRLLHHHYYPLLVDSQYFLLLHTFHNTLAAKNQTSINKLFVSLIRFTTTFLFPSLKLSHGYINATTYISTAWCFMH